MPREVRLRSKVEGGNEERWVPSMMAVSTRIFWPAVLVFHGAVLEDMVARLAAMKSALMSTAETWMDG